MGGGSLAEPAATPFAAVNNPASLYRITRPWASFSYIALIEDVKYNVGSFAVPVDYGVIGASLDYLSYGAIDGYANDFSRVDVPESHDVAAIINYALPLRSTVPLVREHGALGINVKFLQNKLGAYSVEDIAADIGGIYQIPFVEGLNVGAAFKNFGSSVKFVKSNNPLASSLDLGISYRNFSLKNLSTTLDFYNPTNGSPYFSAGVSIAPLYAINLRMGWVDNPDSLFSGFRAGVGLDFGDVTVDYSFTPAIYFSPLHHIGINVAIGNIMKMDKASDYYLEQHFRQACEYYYRKDYIEARQRFEEILSLFPTHHSSQKYLEKIVVGIDNMEQKKEEDIRRLLAQAETAVAKRDFITANSCYNKILAIEPDQEGARTGTDELAQLVAQVKLEQTKQKNCDEILRLWKNGLRLYKKGDFVNAKDRFNAILAIDPGNEDARKYIVDIDNQLTKIVSSQIDELYTTACSLYRREKYEEAVKYFEAVVLAAPHRIDVQDFVERCRVQMTEQKEKARAKLIARQQEEMKDEMSSVFEKGLKAYEHGSFEESLKHFIKSQELAEKFEFKEYLDNSRNYQGMIKGLLSEQHYKAGFEHFRKNRLEAAAREYRKALQYNPENTSAKVELDRISKDLAQQYYEQGMVSFGRADNDKARELFQESLTYQPDKAESRRALERLK
jgi:tetratricopeptide (TPR) repeat protein